MRRAWLVLFVVSIGCEPRLVVPPEAQITCTRTDECSKPFVLCDTEINRCVTEILPAPRVYLSVQPRVGARGSPFTFSATATRPDGGGGAQLFSWDIEGTPFDAGDFAIDTGDAGTLVHRFLLSSGDFCSAGKCENAIARTVSVRVTDASGKRAETRVSVVIENTAPVADFGEDLFIAEHDVQLVTLDVCGGAVRPRPCTAHDSDENDALSFSTWREVSDAGVGWVSNDAGRATFVPPPRWSRPLVFQADVSDGIEKVTGTLRVYQAPVAWAGLSLVNSTFRIHPDFRHTRSWRTDAGANEFNSLDSLVATEDGYWFGDGEPSPGSGKAIVVHVDRNLSEVERWELAGNARPLSRSVIPSLVPVAADGGAGCAVVDVLDAGTLVFTRFGRGTGLLDRPYVPDSGNAPLRFLRPAARATAGRSPTPPTAQRLVAFTPTAPGASPAASRRIWRRSRPNPMERCGWLSRSRGPRRTAASTRSTKTSTAVCSTASRLRATRAGRHSNSMAAGSRESPVMIGEACGAPTSATVRWCGSARLDRSPRRLIFPTLLFTTRRWRGTRSTACCGRPTS